MDEHRMAGGEPAKADRMTTASIVLDLKAAGVRVRSKSTSRLMCLLGAFLGPYFMRGSWTTISGRTIWAPVTAALDKLGVYETIIRHELVHIQQARRLPVLWQLSYLLLPLPIGLAWWRWRWEREAYLVDIRAGREIEEVVDTLWRRYGWPWPRAWMRRWFWRRVGGS